MELKKKFSGITEIFKNMDKDNVTAYSAQCAFYLILSFVPLMILLLTLIQYTGISADELFNALSAIIPESMNEFVLGVVKEIYSKSIGTISISLIITVYAAARGFYVLTRGLHNIYKYTDNKKHSTMYLRLISLVQTVIFIILILVTLGFSVFGRSIMNTLRDYFDIFSNVTALHEVLIRLAFLVGAFLVMIFIYRVLPGHKLTFKSQVPGAIFSAIGITILSFVVAVYLDFYTFTVTYGSLTTLLSIMIWVYFLFYIIFIGAEINKYFGMKTKKREIREKNRNKKIATEDSK